MTKQAAYTQTEEQVLSSVQSTKEGLTSAQAKERLEKYGPNALQAGEFGLTLLIIIGLSCIYFLPSYFSARKNFERIEF